MPANVAASIMSLRAATSFAPSCTARRNDVASSAMARSHHRSETGFDPQ